MDANCSRLFSEGRWWRKDKSARLQFTALRRQRPTTRCTWTSATGPRLSMCLVWVVRTVLGKLTCFMALVSELAVRCQSRLLLRLLAGRFQMVMFICLADWIGDSFTEKNTIADWSGFRVTLMRARNGLLDYLLIQLDEVIRQYLGLTPDW